MFYESETIELKEKYTPNITRELVSFLNTNGGQIYIGITDKGEIVGIDDKQIDETQKMLSDCISYQIEPNPQSEIKSELIFIDGKKVILISINKGFKPIYCIKKYGFSSKGCLVRIGTTCKEMTPEEIEYRYKSTFIDNDYILKAPAKYFPLSFEMMKILLVSKGLHINHTSFEATYNLKRADGTYNLLAELLSDKNSIPLIFVKFLGDNKATISQRSDYGDQSILLGYQKLKDRLIAENICKTNTTVRPRIDEYLYDIDCVNEALVNALVHNDWTISEPLVSFYNDRIEITSHGGIPNNMSKEEFFNGVSRPRNAILMRIFLKLGIVEHTGHGIPMIVERYGYEAFDIHDSYINVIIQFNKNVMETMSQFGKNDGKNDDKNLVNDELTENEKRVLLELINNSSVPYEQLVKDLKISRRTISRIFVSLVEKGYIERIGTNKKGYWKIIK